MERLTVPPQQMDLAVAVISAILTAPILQQRQAFALTAGREPNEGEMEKLRRTVLTEWSQIMQQIRRAAR